MPDSLVQRKRRLIALDEMSGLHPEIKRLERKHAGIPPYSWNIEQSIPAETLHSMLELNPIIVVTTKQHTYCVGNTRLFQAMQNCLQEDDTFIVQEFHRTKGTRIEEIERLFWAERMVLPTLHQHGKDWSKWNHTLWTSYLALATKPWALLPFEGIHSKKQFANIMGCDVRALK
ncbi:MAG: hypothetical protein Q9M19_08540 [Mariprofundaceae bacterium]|nr:hypothetical protein [Mariprofundaceae bacterium]